MRISVEWLKEFVPVPSPGSLAEQLCRIGIEVDAIEGNGRNAVLVLAVTPNRGDCLSHLGIAREISALRGSVLRPKPVRPPGGKGKIAEFLKVRLKDPNRCPRYMARLISGVRIGPSPAWMQRRLLMGGIRPVNNVVDCTNYVLLERGHPLHAFDRDRLKGGTIVIRRASQPFTFRTLDGEGRECLPEDLMICDAQEGVALAGIMGGSDSEVRPETVNLVIEAAFFEPRRIHRSARRLKLKSESSFRFERGVDPNGVPEALHRVCALIAETAGGFCSADWVDCYPRPWKPKRIFLDHGEIPRILGEPVPAGKIAKIFHALGFDTAKVRGGLNVRVPTFRFDVEQSIDLVEEVARLYGYDRLKPELPRIPLKVPQIPPLAVAEKETREILRAFGYSELLPLSFTETQKCVPFYPVDEGVRLFNPLSEEQSLLAPLLLPSMLDAAVRNLSRQRERIKLFALRTVFLPDSRKGVREEKHLGLIACGKEWGTQWGLQSAPVDFHSLKGVLESLAESRRRYPLRFEREELPAFLAPSEGASVFSGSNRIGWVGRLSPGSLRPWDVKIPLYAMELAWGEWMRERGKGVPHFRPLSKYPFIERDAAFVVPEFLEAGRITDFILDMRANIVENVHIFDIFRGKPLKDNYKSIALNIRYASPDRTLTHEEVHAAHRQVVEGVQKAFGVELRG